MTKYELSISSNYVDCWGKVEAVRELFQNALDEQTKDNNNKMFFDYSDGKLAIGNKNSTLEIQTLLMGNTTKHDDKFIGQHGEGYKLATIVLLRENCNVVFKNYNTREIWRPRLVKSRKYKGALVPTFFVEKVLMWQPVPEHSLIIEIDGISEDNYKEIIESNLHLQKGYKHEETDCGSILLDDKYNGKVFVSGLFVCNNKDLKYGYDLKPSMIKLDRDRSIIKDIDLYSITSRIILKLENKDIVKECIGCNDGKYVNWYSYTNPPKKIIADDIAKDFYDEYGDDAVPVSNTSDFNKLHKYGCSPVMVTESEKLFIEESTIYKESKVNEKEPLIDRINEWFDNAKLEDDDRESFTELLEELREEL